MAQFALIRHAKSSWLHEALSDFERPLDARGRREAQEMSLALAADLSGPLHLVSSPALRALTTAQAFADALGLDHGEIHLEPRIYEATPGTLLEIVRGLRAEAGTPVLMFGHNPGFSEFAQILADCPFREMPTCAIARFCLDIDAWSELEPGGGTLVGYRVPSERLE